MQRFLGTTCNIILVLYFKTDHVAKPGSFLSVFEASMQLSSAAKKPDKVLGFLAKQKTKKIATQSRD